MQADLIEYKDHWVQFTGLFQQKNNVYLKHFILFKPFLPGINRWNLGIEGGDAITTQQQRINVVMVEKEAVYTISPSY